MLYLIMVNPMKGGVWYTGTEARTSWMDATIYPNPYATKYDSTHQVLFL